MMDIAVRSRLARVLDGCTAGFGAGACYGTFGEWDFFCYDGLDARDPLTRLADQLYTAARRRVASRRWHGSMSLGVIMGKLL